MYTSVRIQNFRGFEDLTVDGLTRVNLIVGKNGVGKTGLLEAVYMLEATGNPFIAQLLNEWRGLSFGHEQLAENPVILGQVVLQSTVPHTL